MGTIKDSGLNLTSYNYTLEQHLNAIIMARGSLNRADLSAPDDPNYSCILYKTYIPIVTVVALALEVAILLVLLVLDAILFLSVRFKHDYKKVEDMSSSVTELQLAFIRQLGNDTENEIQPRHLTRCAYGFDKAKDMLRFQHVRGAPVSRSL